jgi:glutathione S-transferase
MKLFYAPFSCALSPHIVLRELNLPFTLERVDYATKRTETGQDFVAINPKGYIPALQFDDGTLLTEGPAITQYLVDKYAPGSLAPLPGTMERAQVNSYLTFIGTELHKPWSALFDPALKPEERAAVVAKLHRVLGLIEDVLADGRPYLTGPSFTLADIYLFVVQKWSSFTDVDLAKFRHVQVHAGRIAARSATQAAVEEEGRAAAA